MAEISQVCPFCLHKQDNGEQMECTRFPPVPVAVTIPEQDQFTGEVKMKVNIIPVRPPVTPETSCGEFEGGELIRTTV